MNSAQRHHIIKNYFDQGRFWILRHDGNLATTRSFTTREEAEAYALAMDPVNFR